MTAARINKCALNFCEPALARVAATSPLMYFAYGVLQVRATSLQDLVYKQGQAGITKATVSITFHIDDTEKGPSGYDDKDSITVTRQVGSGSAAFFASLGIWPQLTAYTHRMPAGVFTLHAGGDWRAQQISHQWPCSPRKVG